MPDAATRQVLERLGIDPTTVPAGAVRLLDQAAISQLSPRAAQWAQSPLNRVALAYAVDTEHVSTVGVQLRNLHTGPARDYLLVTRGEGPFWHNLHHALPRVYRDGVGVLVEGPKDARVLAAHGVAAVAYLGIAPTAGHLRVWRRYAGVVVWVPDTMSATRERWLQIKRIRQQCQDLDIRLIELGIPTKDPAELVNDPAALERVIQRIRDVVDLVGGVRAR